MDNLTQTRIEDDSTEATPEPRKPWIPARPWGLLLAGSGLVLAAFALVLAPYVSADAARLVNDFVGSVSRRAGPATGLGLVGLVLLGLFDLARTHRRLAIEP